MDRLLVPHDRPFEAVSSELRLDLGHGLHRLFVSLFWVNIPQDGLVLISFLLYLEGITIILPVWLQ